MIADGVLPADVPRTSVTSPTGRRSRRRLSSPRSCRGRGISPTPTAATRSTRTNLCSSSIDSRGCRRGARRQDQAGALMHLPAVLARSCLRTTTDARRACAASAGRCLGVTARPAPPAFPDGPAALASLRPGGARRDAGSVPDRGERRGSSTISTWPGTPSAPILWIWSVCPSADLAPLGTHRLSDRLDEPEPQSDRGRGPRLRRPVRLAAGAGDLPVQLGDGRLSVRPAAGGDPDGRVAHTAPRGWRSSRTSTQSFVTPDLRERLDEWSVSELELRGLGQRGGLDLRDCRTRTGARYARLEAAITLERAHLVTFLKLTSGVFAGVFIAFLSFFYDPNDRSGFGGKLGLLVGVLFAVLLSLRNADSEPRRQRASDARHQDPPGHARLHRHPGAGRPARPPAGRARPGGPPPGLADAGRRRGALCPDHRRVDRRRLPGRDRRGAAGGGRVALLRLCGMRT